MYGEKSYAIPSQILKTIVRLGWVIAIGVWVSAAMQIVLVAGGYGSMQTVNVMRDGLGDMNSKMTKMTQPADAMTDFVNRLTSKFPANQAEVSTRQILGALENGNKITARINYLLQNIDETSIRSLNGIMASLSADDVNTIKANALNIITRVEQIVSNIEPAKISTVLQTIGQLDSQQFNALLKNLAGVHELKINF